MKNKFNPGDVVYQALEHYKRSERFIILESFQFSAGEPVYLVSSIPGIEYGERGQKRRKVVQKTVLHSTLEKLNQDNYFQMGDFVTVQDGHCTLELQVTDVLKGTYNTALVVGQVPGRVDKEQGDRLVFPSDINFNVEW